MSRMNIILRGRESDVDFLDCCNGMYTLIDVIIVIIIASYNAVELLMFGMM